MTEIVFNIVLLGIPTFFSVLFLSMMFADEFGKEDGK